MIRNIIRIILSRIAVLFLAVTLVFFVIKLVPGDPVEIMLGPQGSMSESDKEKIRQDLGLNLPVLQQYINYIFSLIRLDLGVSYQQNANVSEIIFPQNIATLTLASIALIIALVISFIALCLKLVNPKINKIVSVMQNIGVAIPSFWLAVMFIGVFVFWLQWAQIISSSASGPLILPAITMAIPMSAYFSRVLDEALIFNNNQSYNHTLIARGLRRYRLVFRHGLRHAVPKMAAILVVIAGSAYGGAVIIETIYGRQGIGRSMLDAVLARDLPLVLGIVLVITITISIISLMSDLISLWADPRLKTVHKSLKKSKHIEIKIIDKPLPEIS